MKKIKTRNSLTDRTIKKQHLEFLEKLSSKYHNNIYLNGCIRLLKTDMGFIEPQPIYDYNTLTFENLKSFFTEDESKIIALVIRNNNILVRDISKKLDMNRTNVYRLVRELSASGILVKSHTDTIQVSINNNPFDEIIKQKQSDIEMLQKIGS